MLPVVRDVRYGARLLVHNPGFSAVALAALALGMGAAGAIFGVVDAVLLRPLAFRDEDRLLVIWEKNPAQNQDRSFVTAGAFLGWQQQSHTLEALAAIHDVPANLTGGPNRAREPEEVHAERVSASLFPLLGVQPVLGRAFRPEEDRPGHAYSALLSYRLLQRRFGGDREIVGQSIGLRGESYTVVGVLPPGFSVLDATADVWIPLGLDPAGSGRGRFLAVVARLQPGVDLDRARRELAAIGERMEQANGALEAGWRPQVLTLREELVGDARPALLVVMAAVGLLLLIACGNVANLLLARASSRRKELAVRMALGATGGRIVTQLLTESVLLALAGGALGIALARAAVAAVVHWGPASIPRLAQARVDGRLFLFALGVSLATGILFGAAPAMQSIRGNLHRALTEGGRSGTAGRIGRRMRHTLVVGEIALSALVLIAAGLLIRSFARLRAADPGFQARGLLTLRLPLSGGRNSQRERRIAFFQQVADRIAVLPGVRAVGAVNGLPLTGPGLGSTFAVEGRPAPPAGQRPIALMRSVNPAYFRAMRIPLLAGRALIEPDTAQAPAVIVVSRSLARRFWPAGDPIGQRLTLDSYTVRTARIVGVVGDVKAERIEGEDWPTIYSPYAQDPVPTLTLVVRTALAPLAMAPAVERVVHGLDPDQPVADVRSMEDVMGRALAEPRFHTLLLAAFAQIAFALAAVGIYGVASYEVGQRTHEIGIRVALGAQPREVLGPILGESARLAAYGIAAGLAAAFALTRLMATMLYGVKPTDVYTFVAIAVLLAAVALVASYLPSRRAMAIDPMAALRHE